MFDPGCSDLGMTVGLAKHVNSLYLLVDSPKVQDVVHRSVAAHCNNGEIWHQRLGHFPMNKLQFLNDIKVSVVKNFVCDAWQNIRGPLSH